MRKFWAVMTLALLTSSFASYGLARDASHQTKMVQLRECVTNVGGSYLNSCSDCSVDSLCNMTCTCDSNQNARVNINTCATYPDGIRHISNQRGSLVCGEGG